MKTLFLWATIVFCCSALAQDAPMFRGDLQHTGVYRASGPAAFNGVKWQFHTGGRVISSPAVVGGIVYVGSTDGNLYAVDAGTGALRWKFATKSWVTSSPAVAGTVVYFTLGGHPKTGQRWTSQKRPTESARTVIVLPRRVTGMQG